MKLFIMVGIPGSGKSSYSKTLGVEVVSRDEVRKDYKDIQSIRKRERLVKDTFLRNIENILKENRDVVADATHLTPKARRSIIELGKKYNSEIIVLKMVTPFSECVRRNSLRDEYTKVPIKVMLGMFKSMIDIDRENEKVDKIIYTLGNQ